LDLQGLRQLPDENGSRDSAGTAPAGLSYFGDCMRCTMRRTAGRGEKRTEAANTLLPKPGTATTSPFFMAFTPYAATCAALARLRPLPSRLASISAPA